MRGRRPPAGREPRRGDARARPLEGPIAASGRPNRRRGAPAPRDGAAPGNGGDGSRGPTSVDRPEGRPPRPGTILRANGIRPGRRLGQHFLLDGRILARIVEAAGIHAGESVLEVGPGIGVLTSRLLQAGARVVAAELDRTMAPALAETVAAVERPVDLGGWPSASGTPALEPFAPGLGVVWGDAVRLDFAALAALAPGPWKLCSNLPYYITGPFLAKFLTGGLPWSLAVLTVQAEAAARMLAAPGSRTYGAFSCLVQYHAAGEVLFRVPRRAFVPPPAVESCVIRLRPLPAPPTPAPRDALLRVVRAAFAQRRKTLRNALGAGLALDAEQVRAALAAAGIDGDRRAETLTLAEFGALTTALGGGGLRAPVPGPSPP